MKKLINEFTRMQELAGLNEIKVRKPTSHNVYYVYDKEGMEEPIGPFNLEQANNERRRLGVDYDIMDEKTAKEIYSYLNEIKVRKPTLNIAYFLNQHKEEVFEKMIIGLIYNEDGENINIDTIPNWEEYYDDIFDYTCANMDFTPIGIYNAVQARFEPFPPEVEEVVYGTNIAGRNIYYFTFTID